MKLTLAKGFSQKLVPTRWFVFNSLPARGDFSCLLITFVNSLYPDQARQNVGPELGPICLTPGNQVSKE